MLQHKLVGEPVSLLSQIHDLGKEAFASVADCSSREELDEVRVKYLGKSGLLTALLKQISKIEDLEERKKVGSETNVLCSEFKVLLHQREAGFERELLHARLRKDSIDITLPSRPRVYGRLHPVTKVIKDIEDIFIALGFATVRGPDLEDEFHVFDALNTPVHHPAREKNDTFYMARDNQGKRVVLRTHTSSVQIRTMETSSEMPIKIISSGKVYRNDWDATHSPMFHQVEGLYVGSDVTMGHLKYCINHFLEKFFGRKIKMRMRASFFPFTEPSAEIDIRDSRGQWVEVLGCGMVHNRVLENVNIDSSKYSGFAFGMGVERMAMLKYDIGDLRDLYCSRIDWLGHYGFCFTDLV